VTLPVAVVVVTCNSEQEIRSCLNSIPFVAEIVVVDNGSSDRTVEIVAGFGPPVRLLANPTNLGFAAAANQGIGATNSPLVLFLNPDAEILTSLDEMIAELLNLGAGAAGGRLVDENGAPQTGFNVRAFPSPTVLAAEALLVNRIWPANPINRRYRCLDLDLSRPHDVDQPAGAFLMVRRSVLDAIGGFDERFYPLWFEDVDLCLRIRRAGYRIRYLPACAARHRGGHSLERISVERKQVYWYGSLLGYTDKHFSAPARWMVRAAVAAGAVLRMTARFGEREERRSYRKVMGLALGRRTGSTQVQPHALS